MVIAVAMMSTRCTFFLF